MTDDGQLDPYKPAQIAVFGAKGSGKTELAFRIFDTYPFDRVAIDPNGDLTMPDDAVDLEIPIPARWPAEQLAKVQGDRAKRQTLYFMPDFHEPTYKDDMDRVLGMAYSHGRCCVLFDEVHEGAPANATPPHMRRDLRQGRHRDQTLILVTPRPMTIDPLVISNADRVYIFDLPSPADRKRVADNIGKPPATVDAGIAALGEFEYLRYIRATKELTHHDPLPADQVKHHTGASHPATKS
ncbi:MAG: hypothetical protein ABSF84_02815 [Acidimicrobiales bacterium]|jgi:hypothetical protein